MNVWLAIAAINGFIAVAAGAFGAHGLRGVLPPEALHTFDTAARYQMYHALALGLVAVARAYRLAAWAFLAGIVLFCGSLYALALTGERSFGFITPFGGAALLIGWGMLTCWALTNRNRT
ncbi:MAG TPA: DUF423 domain-containing protein [Rhizomicrobium sp.]|nr:DUF423 domain-containing protein [Rhizomicrobium sp.]